MTSSSTIQLSCFRIDPRFDNLDVCEGNLYTCGEDGQRVRQGFKYGDCIRFDNNSESAECIMDRRLEIGVNYITACKAHSYTTATNGESGSTETMTCSTDMRYTVTVTY